MTILRTWPNWRNTPTKTGNPMVGTVGEILKKLAWKRSGQFSDKGPLFALQSSPCNNRALS